MRFGFYFTCTLFSALVEGFVIPELPTVVENSTNAVCHIHSALYLESLNNGTIWAYKMWDASARQEVGLASGSTFQLGNFDECFDNEIPFETEYCLIKINIGNSLADRQRKLDCSHHRQRSSCNTRIQDILLMLEENENAEQTRGEEGRDIRWAICKPASCDLDEMEFVLQNTINSRTDPSFDLSYNVRIESENCQKRKMTANEHGPRKHWTRAEITFVAVLSILLVAVLTATTLEITRKATKLEVLNCFSAKTSWIEITRTNKSTENNPLSCLHGLRLLLMTGVVCGHSYNTILTGTVLNRNQVEESQRSLISLLNLRGDTAVDVFLMIGGFLAAYSQLSRTVNPLKLVVNRYFRLVPILALTVLYYATFLEHHGSGPLWNYLINPEVEYCRKNWWTNILLLNNYIDTENMCVMPSWYIPIDFHLYVLSIPLCILLRKKPFWGYLATTFCCLCCMTLSFQVIYQNDVHPFYLPRGDFFRRIRQDAHFRYLYIPTHTRGSSYLIGVISGALFSKMQQRQRGQENPFRLSACLTVLGLVLCGSCLIGCTLLSALFLRPAHRSVIYALYGACHRTFYVVIVAIMIFIICCTILDRLREWLAWRVWIALSRLTFGVYLFHLSIQQRRTAEVRTPQYVTAMYLLSSALYEMIICFLFSFVFYVLVEGPFTRIPKLCFSKDRMKYATENRANVKIEMDTRL